MESSPRLSGRQELTTWKEVAEYLGVSVRTAQNWESERGLPVTRLPGRGRGRIVVVVSDLERWKFSAAPEAPGQSMWPGWRVWGAAAFLVLLVSGLAAWRLSRGSPAPSSFRIDQGSLVVCDEQGHELWRRSFEPLLDPAYYHDSIQLERRVFWTGDLDEDGKPEVLFTAHASGLGQSGFLVCYTAEGVEKWRFQPGRDVTTSKEHFSNCFNPITFVVAPWATRGVPRLSFPVPTSRTFRTRFRCCPLGEPCWESTGIRVTCTRWRRWDPRSFWAASAMATKRPQSSGSTAAASQAHQSKPIRSSS